MLVTPHKVDLVIPPSLYPRSDGVHLSGIIRCIATDAGILKPEWAEELTLVDQRVITDPVAIARICMGLAWEEWYIRTQLPEVADHPGEMLLDGVYMTPDGDELIQLILDGRKRYRRKIHEVKATYKSLNTVSVGNENDKKRGIKWDFYDGVTIDTKEYPSGPLTSQFMWLAQGKGYCMAADTNLWDLHVLFVCGDYQYPLSPVAYRYTVEFTDEELTSNWQLMVDSRDIYLLGAQEAPDADVPAILRP